MNKTLTLEQFFPLKQIKRAEVRYYLTIGLLPSQICSLIKGTRADKVAQIRRKMGMPNFKLGNKFGSNPKMRLLQSKVVGVDFSRWGSKIAFAKALGIKRQRLDQILNSQKANARKRLTTAVKHGDIVRPKFCEKCNKPRKVTAHHHDYSKPLDVAWLCLRCHGEETTNMNARHK